MLPRIQFGLASIAAVCSVVVAGCADRSRIDKRSVAQLYQDAVTTTRIEDVNVLNQTAASHPQGEANSTVHVPESEHPSQSDLSDAPSLRISPAPVTQDVPSRKPPSDKAASHVRFSDRSPEYTSNVRTISAQESLPTPMEDEEPVLINEFFEQTDLREAIDIMVSMTGDSVVLDETVSGFVSLQVTDATFEDALQKMLLPLGLVYAVRDGSYIITPPDPGSPLFGFVAKRMHYMPRHHVPTKMVALMPQRFEDYFQASDERNLIVIEAPEAIAKEVLERLQELDQPVQQVVLEAIVCVTAPDSGFRFGMDWNHVVSANTSDQLNVGLSGLAFSAAASPYGLDNAFDDFALTSTFVQLLSQEGYVTIRAQPRVTAKDGEKASISIARETFFSLQPTSSNVLFRQDVQKVDAGISLEITPRIRGDIVSVEIEKAEVSEDIRTNDPSPETTTNPYPIINRRLVSTKVDVKDGSTIVIGGLVQRQTVDRVNRVPFLGAIPGVGHFFRTVEKQEQDAEVAIFISPRIVHTDGIN